MEEGEIMNKDKYKKGIDRMYFNNERIRCCFLCGLADPSILVETEMHHIDGRANSHYVIDLCQNCHTKVTNEQQKPRPRDRSSNASKNKRRAMQIIANAALRKHMAERDLDLGREMINDDDSELNKEEVKDD